MYRAISLPSAIIPAYCKSRNYHYYQDIINPIISRYVGLNDQCSLILLEADGVAVEKNQSPRMAVYGFDGEIRLDLHKLPGASDVNTSKSSSKQPDIDNDDCDSLIMKFKTLPGDSAIINAWFDITINAILTNSEGTKTLMCDGPVWKQDYIDHDDDNIICNLGSYQQLEKQGKILIELEVCCMQYHLNQPTYGTDMNGMVSQTTIPCPVEPIWADIIHLEPGISFVSKVSQHGFQYQMDENGLKCSLKRLMDGVVKYYGVIRVYVCNELLESIDTMFEVGDNMTQHFPLLSQRMVSGNKIKMEIKFEFDMTLIGAYGIIDYPVQRWYPSGKCGLFYTSGRSYNQVSKIFGEDTHKVLRVMKKQELKFKNVLFTFQFHLSHFVVEIDNKTNPDGCDLIVSSANNMQHVGTVMDMVIEPGIMHFRQFIGDNSPAAIGTILSSKINRKIISGPIGIIIKIYKFQ